MKSNRVVLLALLGALGRVAAMEPPAVYSLSAGHLLNGVWYGSKPVRSIPDFQEVFSILSTNLEGVTTNDLDAYAAWGLIQTLEPRVSLVGIETNSTDTSALAEARVFDNHFAYLRVANVNSNLPDAFHDAYAHVGETNKSKIKGIVIDLRFATGFDYAAASKLADLFLSSDHPLLNWQTGSAHATLKNDAITLPVAVLVNKDTLGAAEALAAVLRESDVGLIIGSQTAGGASVFKEIPLSNGSKLRVAVAPVTFGGDKTIPHGVTPDIAITTSQEDERAYLQDPFKILHPLDAAKAEAAAKAAAEQPRMNETRLIQSHANGDDVEPTALHDRPEVTPAPTVMDPALARALDLLKGLAVVQPSRPG